jgi:hypothetical protein
MIGDIAGQLLRKLVLAEPPPFDLRRPPLKRRGEATSAGADSVDLDDYLPVRLVLAADDTVKPRPDLRFTVGGDVEAALKRDWRLLARAARREPAFELPHPDWLLNTVWHLRPP